MLNFLCYVLAAATMGLPYLLWGWRGLFFVLLIAVAFHVAYRIKTGDWMDPL